jgi:hypothetical protein
MIYSTRLTDTSSTIVFTSTTTGAPVGGAVTATNTAITNIIICNTGTGSPTDEIVDQAKVTINLCNKDVGLSASATNTIVSNLIVPAGETIFFSDERIVLSGDATLGSADIIRVTSNASNLISVTVSALEV